MQEREVDRTDIDRLLGLLESVVIHPAGWTGRRMSC
jgi:hypothetical protein